MKKRSHALDFPDENWLAPERAESAPRIPGDERYCSKGGGGFASIALPIALTALGGIGGAALGPSLGLGGLGLGGGATLGGAIGGALGGGLGAGITGGNVGKGALFGAIGGGVAPNVGDIASGLGIGSGTGAGTAGASVPGGAALGASPAGAASSIPSFALGEGIVGAEAALPQLGEGIIGAGAASGTAGLESLAGFSPTGGGAILGEGIVGVEQALPSYLGEGVVGAEAALGATPTTEFVLGAAPTVGTDGATITRVGSRAFEPGGTIPFAERAGFSGATLFSPGFGASGIPATTLPAPSVGTPGAAFAPQTSGGGGGGIAGAILRAAGIDTSAGIGKMLAENAQWAPALGSLGYAAMRGDEMPFDDELRAQAEALNRYSAGLAASGERLMSGNLSTGSKLALDEATASAKTAAKSNYARMGMSGSTSERLALQEIDRKAEAQKQSLIEQQMREGLASMQLAGGQGGLSAQIYGNLLNARLREDEALSSAIADFAAAAAGGGGRGVSLRVGR